MAVQKQARQNINLQICHMAAVRPELLYGVQKYLKRFPKFQKKMSSESKAQKTKVAANFMNWEGIFFCFELKAMGPAWNGPQWRSQLPKVKNKLQGFLHQDWELVQNLSWKKTFVHLFQVMS